MTDDTSDRSLAGRLADDLNECRQRGLADLDMQTHNQEPVEAPELTRLAREYCEAVGAEVYGRPAQITRLIEDGLDIYASQGNEQTRAATQGDQQLITTLFFDSLVTAPTNGPNLAQEKARDDLKMTADEFGKHRRRVFLRFANFLIAFLNKTAADASAAPSRPPNVAPVPESESVPAPTASRSRPPLVWIGAAVAALLVIGGTVATLFVIGQRGNGTASTPPPTTATSPHPSSPPYVAGKTYTEQEGHIGMRNTYPDPYQAAVGPALPPLQKVEVSCKVHAVPAGMTTVLPDGYWYRLASSPYNNQYYAIANSFLNGDPVEGTSKVAQHNTDFSVPDCPS